MDEANATDHDLRNPVSEKASELFPKYLVRPKEATLDGNKLTGRRPLLLIIFRLYTATFLFLISQTQMFTYPHQ